MPTRRLLVLTVLLAAATLLAINRTEPDDAVEKVRSAADMPVGLSYGNRLLGLSAADLDGALDDAVALHAPWIRLDLSWVDIQPDSGDSFAWERTDRVISAAHERGLRVLGIVTYTPAWARASACTTFACPPRDNREFATFAGAVADRYAGRVDAYEIWNEPNLATFWKQPDAVAYGNLLRQTVPAIREADGDATILLGGLAALPTSRNAVDAADFLRAACADGSCNVDAIAYHPYTFPRLASSEDAPPTTWDRMLSDRAGSDGIRAAMAEVGLSDRKIWVTEYGAPTGGRADEVQVTEARQSQILVDGLREAERASDLVGGYFWYTWKDTDVYGSSEDSFGLRRNDGSCKPAFKSLARALAVGPDDVALTVCEEAAGGGGG